MSYLNTEIDQTVDVVVTTMPTFPTTTITGGIFTPNTPQNLSAIFAISNGVTVAYAKWTGTQYISAPVPTPSGVRYGTTAPVVLATDRKNDVYYRTKTGTNTIQPYENYTFDGTVWMREDGEDNFLVHPLDGAPSGVCPTGATSYIDFDGGWATTLTLPSAIGRRNEIFTFRHEASITQGTIVATANRFPATPLTVLPGTLQTQWISDGTVWVKVVNTEQNTNIFSSPIEITKAAGKIVIGDYNTAVLQPGSLNVVSSALNSGSGSAFARFDVALTPGAVSSANYQILYEIEGNAGEVVTGTSTTLISTTQKTLTGFQFALREATSATQNTSVRFKIIETSILANTNNRVKATVNAGQVVQLGNIKIQVPTTAQGRAFEIGTVAGTMTAAVTGMTNYASGSWFTSSNPALALTTTFAHPFGWSLNNDGDYVFLTVRDNSNSDIYKIEMYIGTAFANNIITIEKM